MRECTYNDDVVGGRRIVRKKKTDVKCSVREKKINT